MHPKDNESLGKESIAQKDIEETEKVPPLR